MSRDIYIRSHEFHQFNLFEIGSCCVNCDKQMEKRRRRIWCRWIRGKSDLLLRGKFKTRSFCGWKIWAQNEGKYQYSFQAQFMG